MRFRKNILASIAESIKTIRPPKLQQTQSFYEKLTKETQSLISGSGKGTAEIPLTARKPIPPAVYQEIIQKLKSQFIRGSWKEPVITAPEFAKIKKRFFLAGYDWPIEPYVDLVRHSMNTKRTCYRIGKQKRFELSEPLMKDVPDALKDYKKKVLREEVEYSDVSFKAEQERYVGRLFDFKKDSPGLVQESTLVRRQVNQSEIAEKNKKKK